MTSRDTGRGLLIICENLLTVAATIIAVTCGPVSAVADTCTRPEDVPLEWFNNVQWKHCNDTFLRLPCEVQYGGSNADELFYKYKARYAKEYIDYDRTCFVGLVSDRKRVE
jgi:hypothetical protein